MPRERGRPAVKRTALERNLSHFGGLDAFLRTLDSQELTAREIADQLEAVGKVRVSSRTVSEWLLLLPPQQPEAVA